MSFAHAAGNIQIEVFRDSSLQLHNKFDVELLLIFETIMIEESLKIVWS